MWPKGQYTEEIYEKCNYIGKKIMKNETKMKQNRIHFFNIDVMRTIQMPAKIVCRKVMQFRANIEHPHRWDRIVHVKHCTYQMFSAICIPTPVVT